MAGKTRPKTTTKKAASDKPKVSSKAKAAPRKKSTRKGKARGGRPELISPKLVEDIVLALRIGAPVETAAAHAGIVKDTFYRWLRIGARDKRAGKKNAYTRFSDSVNKAMADAELGYLGVIAESARGRDAEPAIVDEKSGRIVKAAQVERKPEWQAAAWALERRNPERYARRVIHVSEDGAGGPRTNSAPSPQQTTVLPGIADGTEPVFTLLLPPEDPMSLPGISQLQQPATGPELDGET